MTSNTGNFRRTLLGIALCSGLGIAMLPAAAQGVIGIECLESKSALRGVLARLEHAATALTTTADNDCRVPKDSLWLDLICLPSTTCLQKN